MQSTRWLRVIVWMVLVLAGAAIAFAEPSSNRLISKSVLPRGVDARSVEFAVKPSPAVETARLSATPRAASAAIHASGSEQGKALTGLPSAPLTSVLAPAKNSASSSTPTATSASMNPASSKNLNPGSNSAKTTIISSTSPTFYFSAGSPPLISSVNPASIVAGGGDLMLTINGANFTAASIVMWGTTALATNCVSAAQLTATLPAALTANPGTGSVTVSNVTGSSSSATVTINPPQPVITSLSPDSVFTSNGAFTLIVNGNNFQPGAGATVVRWNFTPLSTTYISSTQVAAAVPASLPPRGSTSIYVITAGGISAGFPFTVILPPPIITALSMTQVPAGFGTFTMSICGTYFTPSMVVNWGSTALSGTLVSSTIFTLTVPANLVATAGVVSITVTTIGGTSAPISFTVAPPPPTITSFSPASINAGSASFTLTINGSNFVAGMLTRWGATWVGTTVISPTQLTASIPSSLIATAGTAGIMVKTSGGISASLLFPINPTPPVLSSLSPNLVTAGGAGFMLTIKGTVFTTTSTAMWGTTPLETIYVSPTQLTASIPASLIANAGTASITVVSQAGTSASAALTINPAPPQISGLNPGVTAAGGPAFTIAISGEYFTPSTIAKCGLTALATTYISSTQLTAVVPAMLIASAGTASITVTTAVGTSPPARFTISGLPSLITTTMPSGTAGLPYSGPIHVTGGAPGYAWTVTGLPSSFSYFNTSGSTLTITGTPATSGPISFQVSAQDTVGSTAGPVALTIQVKPGPNGANNGSLNGRYACLMQGSIDDDGTRWASILSFQADGQGSFSNGIFDTNSYDIGSASGIMNGSYSIGADNHGQASIHTILTNNAAGVQTTQWAIALSGSAQPTSEFRMVEADDLGTLPSGQQGTAHCYLATPSAFAASSIDGLSFAYALDGEDNRGNIKATAGQFSTSNGAITSGYLDTSLGGSATDQAARFTGSYTEPDPVWGRFTIALSGAGSSTGYTVYMIDGNRMLILDNTSDDGEQAGNLRTRQTAALTEAALSGPFVLYNRGAQFNASSGIPTSFYANILLGAGGGAGNMTINQSYANNVGVYTAGQSNGGPTALVFDPVHPGRASFSTASGDTYLYFFDANKAFEMSVGTNGSVDTGWLEAQSRTTFTNAALSGNYLFGELPRIGVQPTAYLGEYSLSASGAITAGVTTSAEGILSWDQSLSVTYAWDTLAASSGGFSISNGAQGAASCAVVSATRFACIPQTDPAPSVQIMQQ